MYTVKNLSTSPENKSDDIETVITFSKLMEIIGEAMKKNRSQKACSVFKVQPHKIIPLPRMRRDNSWKKYSEILRQLRTET